MNAADAKLSPRGRRELEELIVSIIKSGLAEKPEDLFQVMRIRSSDVARIRLNQHVSLFGEGGKCGNSKKIDLVSLSRIHQLPMSQELRKFLRRDPELGTRDALSRLLDLNRLYVGRGWTIKIPTPPK